MLIIVSKQLGISLMNNRLIWVLSFVCLFILHLQTKAIEKENGKKSVTIVIPASANSRVKFGAERLSKALQTSGFVTSILAQEKLPATKSLIVIGEKDDKLIQKAAGDFHLNVATNSGKEGFSIVSNAKNVIVAGTDASGALYGCLDLAERIKKEGKLPQSLNLIDKPEMVLRGTCIGLQKPYYLPGRTVYEYPYTPETFPWLYDKQLWIRYLDMMVENRYNSLYLCNGHPFSSFVSLKDYKYSV